MRRLWRLTVVVIVLTLAPMQAGASDDGLTSIQADLAAEEAKPIERQSRQAYVALLNRIDIIIQGG